MHITRNQIWVRYYMPSYLYAGLIFAISSYSLIVPSSLPHFSDELIHFCEYAVFGFLLARSYSHANINFYKKYFIIFAFLTGSAWGFLDEGYQNLVPHRGFEFFDFLADAAGVLAGALIYKICRRTT